MKKHRSERGMTVVVVLVLLTVMLMGGLALARLAEVGTLVSGNIAFRDRALQASEEGIDLAFVQIQNLPDEEVTVAPLYYASSVALAIDPVSGLPVVNWAAQPVVTTLGLNAEYSVRYVIERMCDRVPVVDPLGQCLLTRPRMPESARAGTPRLDPLTGRQFRVTVRVSGPKSTQLFVQSMVTRS